MILIDIFGQNPIQGPGTATFTEHLVEIIAMLLAAFLLGWWLGRIAINKWRKKFKDTDGELQHLKAESLGLEDTKLEIITLSEKVKILEDKNSRLRMDAAKPSNSQSTSVLEARLQTQDQLISKLKADLDLCKKREADFNASVNVAKVVAEKNEPKAEKPVPAKPIKKAGLVAGSESPRTKSKSKPAAKSKSTSGDDLKKIEGVGPKIEQLLNADGINTYKELIGSGADKIKEILLKAGPQYKVHDPSTWSEQAQLALSEKWDELHEMQAQLKGGKKV